MAPDNWEIGKSACRYLESKTVKPKVSATPANNVSRQLLLPSGPLDLHLPLIVGVVNATPDSFSDRGSDRSTGSSERRVHEQIDAGADVIEVGGESNVSNRPAVAAAEEIERIVPVVSCAAEAGAVVSIDTYKPEVAAAALDAGAAIVNDISGFADQRMIELCAERRPGVVLMHTSTPPKVSRWDDDLYPNGVAEEIGNWFAERIGALESGGVDPAAIALDPGIDFGKTPFQSVEMMRGFASLNQFGKPLMAAVSRKDFIGALTDRIPSERLPGTLAAIGWAAGAGARLIRAHDVAAVKDYLTIQAALEGWTEVEVGLRIDEAVRREPQVDRFAVDRG